MLQVMFKGEMMDFRTAAIRGCWAEFSAHVYKMLSAKAAAGQLSETELETLSETLKERNRLTR